MHKVTFGMFDWLDRRPGPLLHDLYDERLELVALAEQAGFHGYYLAEHHGTPLGLCPSPNVFLSALARSTTTIRLGPMCWLLPLYEPLRLFEELCMLDQLSHGRLEVGLGRGVSRHELGFYNLGVDETRARFEEALAVLLRAIEVSRTGGTLTTSGPHYAYREVPLVLSPLQDPYPPLWYPTSSLSSAAWAGSRHLHLMGLGPARQFRALADAYRRAAAAPSLSDAEAPLNPDAAELRVGMNRQIIVCETDDEARRVLDAAFPAWKANFTRLAVDRQDAGEASQAELRHYEARTSLHALLDDGVILAGSPETVRRGLADVVRTADLSYLACTFAWGAVSSEQARRSLSLFADEVAPSFLDGTWDRSGAPSSDATS